MTIMKSMLPAAAVVFVLALAAPANGQYFGVSFGHHHFVDHPHHYGHSHHYYLPHFRFRFETPHHYSHRPYHSYPYWHRRNHW